MQTFTQEEFVKHFESLFINGQIELDGEIWTYHEEKHCWVRHEQMQFYCPVCADKTGVSVIDDSAMVRAELKYDPVSRNVHIGLSNADIELFNLIYECENCGTKLPYQTNHEFSQYLHKQILKEKSQ